MKKKKEFIREEKKLDLSIINNQQYKQTLQV